MSPNSPYPKPYLGAFTPHLRVAVQLLLNHGSEGYEYGAGLVQTQRHFPVQERPGFLGGLLVLEQLVFLGGGPILS